MFPLTRIPFGREKMLCWCRGRMAAGDKHESADNVPAVAPPPCSAVQTDSRKWQRMWLGARLTLMRNFITSWEKTHAGKSDWRETRVYLSHLYKWGTGWAHSLQAKYVLSLSISQHTHTHTHTHSYNLSSHAGYTSSLAECSNSLKRRENKHRNSICSSLLICFLPLWQRSGNKAECRTGCTLTQAQGISCTPEKIDPQRSADMSNGSMLAHAPLCCTDPLIMSKSLHSQLATGNKCISSSASTYRNAGRGYFDLPYEKKCHMKVFMRTQELINKSESWILAKVKSKGQIGVLWTDTWGHQRKRHEIHTLMHPNILSQT